MRNKKITANKQTGEVVLNKEEAEQLKRRLAIMHEWGDRALLPRSARKHDRTEEIDRECDYPTDVTVQDYLKMFERADVARRVITVYPEYCWKENPEIYEVEENKYTKFERAWNKLASDKNLNLFQALLNIDTICAIGRYGILVLGFDDGKDLSMPVTQATSLMYLRAFDESCITIIETETDKTNPRYALPTVYELKVSDGKNSESTQRVHYTRVIHVAENTINNPTYGTPRLQAVYNRFLDIKKILGGSAEMFWKGGFPGFVFNLDPEADVTDDSLREMKTQIHRYAESLDRYLSLQGVDVKPLSVQVASPEDHLKAQFEAISATTGIPIRVLFGSEQAQLASTQDRKNWYDRILTRRRNFCIPSIVNPFVLCLIEVGVLPTPKNGFKVHWAYDTMLDDKERADLARIRTEALARYSDSPLASAILPIDQFLTRFLGFSIEETAIILADMTSKIQDEMDSDSAVDDTDDESVIDTSGVEKRIEKARKQTTPQKPVEPSKKGY